MEAQKKKIPILSLDFKDSFEQLSQKEKEYTYYLYKSNWEGLPINLFQLSYESPGIFVILQKYFASFKPFSELKATVLAKANPKVTEDEFNEFLNYAALFYSNVGNYSSFGMTKFIPKVEMAKLEAILKVSTAFNEISPIWEKIKDVVYNESSSFKTINLEEKGGKNSYYLGGISEEEIKAVDKVLQEKKIDPLNTRLMKTGPNAFACLIGSIDKRVEKWSESVTAYYGEFCFFLNNINLNLVEAQKNCANERQKKMYDHYIESFKTGSIDKHKDSQREWVKDKNPIVETNIGWVETYVDPFGVRGYYEGWVALTDKQQSQKFNQLVGIAEKLLATLPWPKDFEKDTFCAPDFISLTVVSFATFGCPIGINIPNYSDVQETDGFKNLSLQNAYPSFKPENMNYCSNKDKELLQKFGDLQMVVVVAGHELLGHGSGKLLRQNDKGEFNFNKETLINPLTNQLVDQYYKGTETFEAKFTQICRSIEECRADLTGFFFAYDKDVQKIFGVKEEDAPDVLYCMLLCHFRKGIIGLTLFNDENKKWGQAHTQGAWAFITFILENQTKGKEILQVTLDEEKKTFDIIVNKDYVVEYGRELVSKMLQKIHIWKMTGDCASAKEFYDHYSIVNDFFLKIRAILVENTTPRRLELFHNLIRKDDNSIGVKEYPNSCEGIIESYIDRFNEEHNKEILNQWTLYDSSFFNQS